MNLGKPQKVEHHVFYKAHLTSTGEIEKLINTTISENNAELVSVSLSSENSVLITYKKLVDDTESTNAKPLINRT